MEEEKIEEGLEYLEIRANAIGAMILMGALAHVPDVEEEDDSRLTIVMRARDNHLQIIVKVGDEEEHTFELLASFKLEFPTKDFRGVASRWE